MLQKSRAPRRQGPQSLTCSVDSYANGWGWGREGYVNSKATSWSLRFRNAYRGPLVIGLGTGNGDPPYWGHEKVMAEAREGQVL